MSADIEITKEKELATSSSSDAEVEPELVRKAHFKGDQITCPHYRRLTYYQNLWSTSPNGVMPKF